MTDTMKHPSGAAPAVSPCACCGMLAKAGSPHLCTREVLLALGEALDIGAI